MCVSLYLFMCARMYTHVRMLVAHWVVQYIDIPCRVLTHPHTVGIDNEGDAMSSSDMANIWSVSNICGISDYPY